MVGRATLAMAPSTTSSAVPKLIAAMAQYRRGIGRPSEPAGSGRGRPAALRLRRRFRFHFATAACLCNARRAKRSRHCRHFCRPAAASALLGNGDLVLLGEVLGRFLAPVERLGNRLEAVPLGRERTQLAGLVGLPGLLVTLEAAPCSLRRGLLLGRGLLRRRLLLRRSLGGARVDQRDRLFLGHVLGLQSFGMVALVVPSVT